MEIIINPFGEPSEDWEAKEREAVSYYLKKLETYPGGYIPANVVIKNIGRGADWHVVSLSILCGATSLFFAIPEVHKKIRESLEEWKRIYNEFQGLIKWLANISPVYFPDHYLFLCALRILDEETEASELVFNGCHPIPNDNPDMQGLEDLIFNFINGKVLESIAVSRQGEVLWHNSTKLIYENA